MDFLKKLFGGGSAGGAGAGQNARLFYVRPKRCDEIVIVRVNMMNDLSQTDDGDGYFVRKMVRANRCPFTAELHISFDKNRKITQIGVQDGESVEEAEYNAWAAAHESSASS
ncbi:MAG TPA: hypothetical protein VHL11_13215 [Phototrophicaceae bacterium]|jgi:hypothetical protein|nr:hypothetical protein [Phototrophicaceae bacterium]